MAKYRMTEDQLQKVFESLEMKRMTEMDNYNYPMGSDTPSAPWNQQDPVTSRAISANGDFKLVANVSNEYLILNEKTKQLLYTMDEVWDEQNGRNWEDIKDQLSDFLEIPQEDAEDEDGKYSTNAEDWKEFIDSDEVASALVSYMNYYTSKGQDLGIVDYESWENGEGHFLAVTPENVDEVYNETLRQKAKEMLGVNQEN
jgi:hypothetical protein